MRLQAPTARTTVATAVALACATLPVFLFGALSELVRADLGFDEAGVGAGVTVFFVAAGLGAYPAGRVTERVGARTAMILGATTASAAGAGLGLLAWRWWHAAALLAVAGASVGLVDTGGARAFADVVPARRQGLTFGLKEASVPAASMLAGVTVPVLGLTVGWRPSFGVALLLVPLVWALLPRRTPDRAEPPPSPRGRAARSRAVLALVAVGSAARTGAATAAASFLVPAAMRSGLSAGTAGTALAAGSLSSILVRVAAGHLADRAGPRELAVTTGMLAVGAVGGLLLMDDAALLVVAGGLLVLGAGWGWTGLVFLSAVRADAHAPASAAGIVLTGLATGGALGPAAFGVVVSRAGYPAAWALVTAALAAAAITVWTAHRRLGAGRPAPAGPSPA